MELITEFQRLMENMKEFQRNRKPSNKGSLSIYKEFHKKERGKNLTGKNQCNNKRNYSCI